MLVHQNLVQSSSLLRSRLKLYLPLKIDDLLHPPGSHPFMYFVFYAIDSIRSFACALDMTRLSIRYNKNFMRRSNWPPLDIMQHVINYPNREGNIIWRARVNKGRAVDNVYEFNKLLLKNGMTMETSGCALKLDKIIEKLSRHYHLKSRIAIRLTKYLPIEVCSSGQEYASFIKR